MTLLTVTCATVSRSKVCRTQATAPNPFPVVGRTALGARPGQCGGEHVGDGGGQVERHDVTDLFGHVFEIGSLRSGMITGDAGPVGGEHLLLDAPIGSTRPGA